MRVAIAELTNDGHTGVARFALEAQKGFRALGIDARRVLGGARPIQKFLYESSGDLAFQHWVNWANALNEFDAVLLTDLHATRHDEKMPYLAGLASIRKPVVSYAHGQHYDIKAVDFVLAALGGSGVLRKVLCDGPKNVLKQCPQLCGYASIPYERRFAEWDGNTGSPGRHVLFIGTLRILKGVVAVIDAAAELGYPTTIIGGCGNHAGVTLPTALAYLLRDSHAGTWLTEEPANVHKPCPWSMDVKGAKFHYLGMLQDIEGPLLFTDMHVSLTSAAFQPSQFEYTTLEAIDAGHAVVTQSWRADHRPWRVTRVGGFEEPVGVSTRGGKYHANWKDNDKDALLFAMQQVDFQDLGYNRAVLAELHSPARFAEKVIQAWG